MTQPLASIVSAGVSKFGVREGLYGRELFAEAAREAFDSCPNLNPKRDIQALFVGMMSDSYEHQAHVAPLFLDWIGLLPKPAYRTEGACTVLQCGAANRFVCHCVWNVRCRSCWRS